MQEASAVAEKTIAVLSPDFFESRFTQPEWAAAFRQDPTGTKGLLLPIRVRVCDLAGLLPQIIYIDLVDLAEDDARARLLLGVSRARAKPTVAPPFPEQNIRASGLKHADRYVEEPLPNGHDTARSETGGAGIKTLNGRWKARFSYIDGQWYEERIEVSVNEGGEFAAHIIPSLDNYTDTARVDLCDRSARTDTSTDQTS